MTKPAAKRPKPETPDFPAKEAAAELERRGGISAWRSRMGFTLDRMARELGYAGKQSAMRLVAPGESVPDGIARLAIILEDGYRQPARQRDTKSGKPE